MLSRNRSAKIMRALLAFALILAHQPQAVAADDEAAPALPESTSPQFCIQAQKLSASTTLTGENTLFTDMPSYRHSKPMVKPLSIYQVVTYDRDKPMVVSCKLKTAAHLRAAYGADAAGEQKYCHHLARTLQHQAVKELNAAGDTAAAERAAAFVIDEDEPYIAGKDYLKDFHTIYRAADGVVHVSTPGLYQDYDAWYTFILPEIVQGQSYCHLATVESLKAVATGQIQPGIIYNTGDDATTQPH